MVKHNRHVTFAATRGYGLLCHLGEEIQNAVTVAVAAVRPIEDGRSHKEVTRFSGIAGPASTRRPQLSHATLE